MAILPGICLRSEIVGDGALDSPIDRRIYMKKYEYVNVNVSGFLGSGTTEHREIIEEYAAKGYRYVGYIPTDRNNNGKIYEIDLIFEIDA